MCAECTQNCPLSPIISFDNCVDGPKSDGENPKAIAVTSGQMFRAEPLSSKTDGTLRLEQATSMNKGRTWLNP